MKLKSITAGTFAAMLTFCSAYADAPAVISAQPTNAMYINGAAAERGYITDSDGEVMLPVRALCENLGMNVGWDENSETVIIEKLPVYITFSPYSDGYTFAKTAPMKLGKAPKLIDDITYVPSSFADEILGADVKTDDEGIYITVDAHIMNKAVITEKSEGKLTLYDVKRGEIIVNITDDTVITGSEGILAKAEDLKIGTAIDIEYANFMTMSLPPITNAVKIIMPQSDALYEVMSGKICAIEKDDLGVRILIGEKDDMYSQTALNISVDTKITAYDGSDADFSALKENQSITAVVSAASTRSIPPQRSAIGIIVVGE